MVDRAVAEHLEVLGGAPGRRGGVGEGVPEAHALDRGLGDPGDGRGRFDVERVEHGRHHVDDVRVLRSGLTAGGDTPSASRR